MSKKDFNFNSNIDLFENLKKISDFEKSLVLENGAFTSEEVFLKEGNPKNTFQSLIEKKCDEFLMGKVKPYTLDEIKVVEDKVFEYKIKKTRTEDRLDLAEEALKKAMEKRNLKYSLPIVKNKKLKRAAKRFFGERKKEITFADYKKALKRMKQLQKSESKGIMEKKED
jgi:hypothetical protein